MSNETVEGVEKNWSSANTASYQNLIEGIPRMLKVIIEAKKNTLSIDVNSFGSEI